MFVGREKELQLLENLYDSTKFEFLVLYGRRRIGKTALLTEFCRRHECIFYPAKSKNDALNLHDFSETIEKHYNGKYFGTFDGWERAFAYIAEQETEKRQVLIIDEFPFIASENPSVKSILQHVIDHKYRDHNLFLILCGSSISFMENEVMGYESPLYGRSTSQLELKEFDYLESSVFFPEYSEEEKLIAYGILGGIPCYLEKFDSKKSLQENIADNILKTGSFLKEEPQLLLRMELREPAIYNSIFEAIANGASRMNEIADKIHEAGAKCSKYIDTLRRLRLIVKNTPCGEKENSRKTIYAIQDNFFQFWYQYVFSNKGYYEIMGEKDAAQEIMEANSVNAYMGHIFEKVCMEYMIRQAKLRRLPFIPNKIGRWWGNNPKRRAEDDVDILLIDKTGKSLILCECKFRNDKFSKEDYEVMLSRKDIFGSEKQLFFYVFSKSGFSAWVEEQAEKEPVMLVSLPELFGIYEKHIAK